MKKKNDGGASNKMNENGFAAQHLELAIQTVIHRYKNRCENQEKELSDPAVIREIASEIRKMSACFDKVAQSVREEIDGMLLQ